MKCPTCAQESPPPAKFCQECGAPVSGPPGAASYADLNGQVHRLSRALTEALQQQTATSEILRVISRSPTDLQPVLDAIAENAGRVCAATDAVIYRIEGDSLRIVATYGSIPKPVIGSPESLRPITRDWVTGRAVVDRVTVHVPDLANASDGEFPRGTAMARQWGHRTTLATPLLRGGVPVGAILIRRMEVRPFTDKQIELLQTFADQALIAIENVRLFTELQTRNRDLTEALERQTATSEILRIISSSPTDVQPVFDTIASSASRLCGGVAAIVTRFDCEMLHLVAQHNPRPGNVPVMARLYPRRPGRDTTSGRAIIERNVVHIPDAEKDPDLVPNLARDVRAGSILAVPMLREGRPIGAISVSSQEKGAFAVDQVELLKTFADQAVIAIENVRLFNEMKEALERQTATSEILRVISSSPTDVQPVLDAVAANAARLCDAEDVSILEENGPVFRVAAARGASVLRSFEGTPISRGSVAGRALLEGRLVHVHDIEEEPEGEFPVSYALLAQFGHRTLLAMPLLREGTPLGVIFVRRTARRPFSDKQVELLQTFADQAVIAIENVRLFTELQEKNRALTQAHVQVTETLAQQTATSEILRVIASSRTDLQPVFDTILQNAVRLCGALNGFIWRLEDGLRQQVSYAGVMSPEWEAIARSSQPGPPTGESVSGWVQIERRVLHVRDLEQDERFPRSREMARAMGYRSLLAVPMLSDQDPVGAIVLHKEAPFDEGQIQLLCTFADQAVIAIQNARLLAQLQARTADLSRSVEQLTALGDVGRALSSTLDLDAVLQAIVIRASQLAGTDACSVFEYDEATGAFHLRATNNLDEEVVALARQTPTRKGEGSRDAWPSHASRSRSRTSQRRMRIMVPFAIFFSVPGPARCSPSRCCGTTSSSEV